MTTLDVAIRARFINQLQEAKKGAADLKEVELAAKRLNGARGGEKISKDLQGIARPADKAEREIRDVEQAARRLNNQRGGERLARDLGKVGAEAKKADDAVKRLSQNTRSLGGSKLPGLGGTGIGAGLAEGARDAGSSLGLPPVLVGGGLGIAGGAAAAGVAGIAAALGGSVRSAMAFEDAMAEVRKAVEMGDAEFANLEQTILRISRETPLAKEQIALLVAQAGFAGRPVQDLARFGTFAAKAAVAFGLSAEESGERLAKLGNVFQLNQKQIEDLADAVNYLGDNMAAKEADIMEFLSRAGDASRTFGLSEAETAAFGSALLSLGVSSEVASNGFSTLVRKLQTSNKQGKDFQTGLKAIGLSAKQVQTLISKGPAQALVDIFGRLDKLAPDKRAGVLVDLFGLEYADDAGRMAGSLKLIVQALDMINDPSKRQGSVDRAFSIFDELTSSKLTKAGNQFKALGANIGKWLTPAIGGAAEMTSSLIELMNQLFERAARIDDMIAKRSKGEQLSPAEQAELDKNPLLKRDVDAGQRRAHHALFTAKDRVDALTKKRDKARGEADAGVEGAKEWLEEIERILAEARAEFERLLALPGAKEAMATTMQGVTEAIVVEGEKAKQEAKTLADYIRNLFGFTVSPTISPQFAPPAGGGGSGGAKLPDGSPVPTPPKRTSSAGAARTVAQTNHFHINGGDPQAAARAVEQRLARLSNPSSSLYDTVG